MSVRMGFEGELENLKNLIRKMGERALNALTESMEALVNQDVERALEIIDKDYKINRLDEEINEKVIWLIAKQQPVASDLRKIIASIKISTDLERIGDQAVNIAKSTIRIGDKQLFKPLKDIPDMGTKVSLMLSQVLDTFHEEDANKALKIADLDDEVDEMYGSLVQELLDYIAKNPDVTSQVTQLAFICRYLERIGDHATNISENVVFMVKGKLYDLNS